jgi:hypothetical protein
VKKVIPIGEILVEIMAAEVGEGFLEPIPLIGQFPSGAPAIFIDQAAKLGQPCGLVGEAPGVLLVFSGAPRADPPRPPPTLTDRGP